MTKHPIEPFRIKAIEPIRLLSRAEREQRLVDAGFNVFKIRAEDVYIDLLTDSGTGAMSQRQWGGILQGDESYAGCRNYYHLRDVVQDITGYPHVIPTHQGRSAEHMLFTLLLEKGDYVVSNTHFDTTRANVLYRGAIPIDLPDPSCEDVTAEHPFKGNLDCARFEELIAERPGRVKVCVLTITNNSVGGQPVSVANVKQVSDICKNHNITLLFDCARFAENAWFVSQREASQSGRSLKEIAQEIFRLGDGCWMSSKKDGLANIGGFIAVRDEGLAERVREMMVVIEGFPTYGGLAGRDLEAVARGLEEVLTPEYLSYRTGQVQWLGDRLTEAGAAVVRPIGGHAVFIDAGAMYPHIPASQFPGQTLTIGFYREGGIRTVEIGSMMFGGSDPETGEQSFAPHELVRLAVPRRVYTATHLQQVVDTYRILYSKRERATGFAIDYQSQFLRHFTARLRELPRREPETVRH
ncbi:MAG: tryptophanase [Candidatus Zixiibacteriota bacterium]